MLESKVRCPRCGCRTLAPCPHPTYLIKLPGRWYRCVRCMTEFCVEVEDENIQAAVKR